jgi:hypothetical protein
MNKTVLVKSYLKNGDIKNALKVASTFRLTFSKSEIDIIKRGYECIVHKSFYEQILNTEEAIDKAKKLVYSKLYKPVKRDSGVIIGNQSEISKINRKIKQHEKLGFDESALMESDELDSIRVHLGFNVKELA